MRMITNTMSAGLVLMVATACAGAGSGPDLGSVDPCDLLTPAQIADAGLGAGRSTDTGPLRSCTWMPEGSGFGVPVILAVLPDADLDEIRAAADSTGAAGFGSGSLSDLVDTEVGGFPAIRADGELCAMYVDVGSGLLSMVGADDCARQEGMVELAVANLPA